MQMKKILNFLFILIFAGFITSCADEDELVKERIESLDNAEDTVVIYIKGSVDFSNYVAVGNSLTAGYMDGALYKAGQLNSMPNLLASSFTQVDSGEFVQAIIDHPNGFNASFSDPSKGVIKGRTILDTSIPGPVPTDDGDIVTLQTPFSGDRLNNYGIPGIRAVEIASGLLGDPTTGNPYYNAI